MSKTLFLTEEQFRLMRNLAIKDGMVFIKHLPDSSDFRSKQGSWKQTWISYRGNAQWPKESTSDEEIVGCHVVDVESRYVYIYPKKKEENSSIIRHEDDYFFLAERALLVPFKLSDATYIGHEESAEEGLRVALSKITSL